MSAIFKDMLRRGHVSIVAMADIDHPAAMINAWTGLGSIDFGGTEYQGFGQLATIAPIQSSTEIEVQEVRFGLSGVDAEMLDGLSLSVKGRFATVYEGLLDEHYRVVSREILFTARLDYQGYRIDPDSGRADVDLVANAGFFHLLNRSGAKMSPEEAKAIDPAETGYDEMHLQQDAQLIWRPA